MMMIDDDDDWMTMRMRIVIALNWSLPVSDDVEYHRLLYGGVVAVWGLWKMIVGGGKGGRLELRVWFVID